MNPRITAKERGLLKGAIRRVFSRSELHERVLARYRIEHEDPNRPRCKKWVWCASCGCVVPQWTADVDHVDPVVPVDSTTAEMSLDEIADRAWCDEQRLQVLCEMCHDAKSKFENALRRTARKERNNVKPKRAA